jgi:predicted phage terminase large subunit-like protein
MTIAPFSLEEVEADIERTEHGFTLDQEAAGLGKDLREFVRAGWHVVEPSTVFSGNWHIDAICEHLEACSRGEIRRLLINIPPRHMKSLAVSVFWPVWTWTVKPQTRFLTASYGERLAMRDATKSRDLLRSAWFRARWPHVQLKGDVNRVTRYENTATGYRIATSVGGDATGEGGDVIILDDPHKAEEAQSDVTRQRVLDWHASTIATRFNDLRTGVQVIVMQRLHERDLAGYVLEREGWTHLCLPARYEPAHPFVWPDDPRTEPGELLWPDHVPEDELVKLAADMTSFHAAGQLQQRPAALEGSLLKRYWWRFYPREHDPENLEAVQHLPVFDQIVESWDTSLKDASHNDFVAGQVWGAKGADRYLLRTFHRRANVHALVSAVREMHAWVEERWPTVPHRVLIENTASGPDAMKILKREIPGVIEIKVTAASGGKEQRALAAAVPLESHNVFVPGDAAPETAAGYHAADWVESLIEECATFPNGAHDDQVDAFSQAMNWIRENQSKAVRTKIARGSINLRADPRRIVAAHRRVA